MQEALKDLGPSVSWIGSVQAASEAAFAIPIMRLVGAYGPRKVAFVGALIASSGPFLASFSPKSFPGLLITEGLVFGIGQSLIFFPAATLPSSYFQKRRNMATGLTYAGGGISGAGFSLLSSVLLRRWGVAWSLRCLVLVYLCITLPASYLIRARLPTKPLRGGGPAVDWAMFKDPRFVCMFFGISFALFPLFGFNLSSALGRIGFGLGADRLLGSLNAMILCLFVFGTSTMIIWPFATSLAPLAVFAVNNGAVAGVYSLEYILVSCYLQGWTTRPYNSPSLPRCGGEFVRYGDVEITFGMMVSGWAGGYALGAPIAVFACGLMCCARLIESKDLKKRV
ncbi:BQ2448_2622 [Microbotryum intermedium]|uniref:BQ2448_2622 protein n=1 Tax=Microbotryum intermedium TaxID=269621 RepID=A0A238F6X2_9BASI|nr:BQ2448_2622 [Microbotryum intermedium]